MENHKSKEYSKHVINSINNTTPNVKPKLKIKIHNKTKPSESFGTRMVLSF